MISPSVSTPVAMQQACTLPVSAIVATRNRSATLTRVFQALRDQSAQPADIVVVDGSDDDQTAQLCEHLPAGILGQITYFRAATCGAATQRSQAISAATRPVVWFLDDDVVFQPECVEKLYTALMSDPKMGGVNATIVNQQYHSPGRVSRVIFAIMAGSTEPNWAGRVLGPAVNLLPEDRHDLPEIVPVEWLNTTCTMYRREALPTPLFPEHFTGYSLFEDVALSLVVGRKWKLANARTARIYHDSQPGCHKSDPVALAEMQLTNRHYVMTKILQRRRFRDYLKLLLFEAFTLASQLPSPDGRRLVVPGLKGRARAVKRILRS